MSILGRKTSKRLWLKSLPKRASSAAMILENSIGQVLIVKSGYKPYWTFPGGVIDPHETPKQAAIRETAEEVGLSIDSKNVTFVAVIDRKSSYADTYQFVFRAPLQMNGVGSIILQESEIDEYQLVTREQVLSGDRKYGRVILHWANNDSGYMEQQFGGDGNA